MIRKMVFDNFQAHKHSVLRLSEGVNAIVGSSDSGKSSIIRGLYWLCRNRPLGIEFLREGTDDVSVSATLDSGVKVTRFRSRKGAGGYSMDTPHGEVPLRAVGSDVPQEVSDALNLREINIQLQLDSHFMLRDTPGKRAEILNKVTKFEEIVWALKALRGKRDDSRKQYATLTGGLQRLADYNPERRLARIAELEKAFDLVRRKSDILSRVVTHNTHLNLLIQRSERLPDVSGAEVVVSKLLGMLDEVSGGVDKVQKKEDIIHRLEKELEKAQGYDVSIHELKSFQERDVSELRIIRGRLKVCPKCGAVLTSESRGRLLNE